MVRIWASLVHNAAASGLRGLGEVRTEALTEVVVRTSMAAVMIVLMLSGAGIRAVSLSYLLANLAVAAMLHFRLLSRSPRPGVRHAGPTSRQLPALGLIIGLPLGTIYWRLDLWMLAYFVTSREVADYAAGFRLLDGVLILPTAVGALTAREIALASRTDHGRTLIRLAVIAVGVVLPISAVAAIFPNQTITTLFGDAFVSAGPSFRWLMLAAIPSAMVIPATQALGVIAPRPMMISMFAVLALNVGLNLLLMPRFGATAAAVTTFGCQSLLAIALFTGVARARPRRADGTFTSAPRGATSMPG